MKLLDFLSKMTKEFEFHRKMDPELRYSVLLKSVSVVVVELMKLEAPSDDLAIDDVLEDVVGQSDWDAD